MPRASEGCDVRLERLLLLLSLSAVAAYCCALPLWEGWDEPFHYGYVESLAVRHELPVYGRATLTREIDDSLRLTPLPNFLASAVPGSTSFREWHTWTAEQRAEFHEKLNNLPGVERLAWSAAPNYEAHHAPLAYALLTPFDCVLGGLRLTTRVLCLRLLLAIGGMLLLYTGLRRLSGGLGLNGPLRWAFLFCAFSVEMVWATLGHIGNDAFAVPVTVWLLALWAEEASLPLLGLVLAVGLLTKAYFLCFVPVLGVYGVRRFRRERPSDVLASLGIAGCLAGPWYARNVLLYSSLSGTTQSQGGATFLQSISAALHMNWLLVGYAFLRNSLWTGNWSYTSFARLPLNLELLAGAAALVLYCRQFRAVPEREVWLWAACAAFGFGVFYQAGATAVLTHGRSSIPDPWYWQGVLLCLMAFGFLGLQRSRRLGRLLATALIILSMGIAAVTLVGKQLPAYADGNFAELSPVVLAPLPLLLALLMTYFVLLVWCGIMSVRRVVTSL